MSDFGLQVWDADITVEFILKSSARFHINYKKCILGMYLVGFELRFFCNYIGTLLHVRN